MVNVTRSMPQVNDLIEIVGIASPVRVKWSSKKRQEVCVYVPTGGHDVDGDMEFDVVTYPMSAVKSIVRTHP